MDEVDTAREDDVAVAELLCESADEALDTANELVRDDDAANEDSPPAPVPGVRYQFACGSCRHSPTVTPFQPFCLIKSKKKGPKSATDGWIRSC